MKKQSSNLTTGLSVEEIEDGLKTFEKQEKIDMDEFYQLKDVRDIGEDSLFVNIIYSIHNRSWMKT